MRGIDCTYNESYVINTACLFRATARNVYVGNVSIILLKQLNDIQIHMEAFYRYATFQKFPVDRWENVCDYLSGRGNHILFKILMDNLGKYITPQHPCPYKVNETVSITAERFDVRSFHFEPLLPAGDYRLIVTYAEGKERHWVFSFELTGSVSDHRIWH